MTRREQLALALSLALIGLILLGLAAQVYQVLNPPSPERTEKLNAALQEMQWGGPNPWAGQPFKPQPARGGP